MLLLKYGPAAIRSKRQKLREGAGGPAAGARRDGVTAAAAVVLLYVVMELLGITCPIRFLTGISCAGCGMSRAWLSLLRLDFAAAVQFHPLFWLPVPAAALLLFRRRLPRRVFQGGLTLCAALFLIVYLIRLFQPGEIVVFAPSQGLIWRLASRLLVLGG